MMSRVLRCTKGLGVALLALGSEREGPIKRTRPAYRIPSISVRQNARLLVIDRSGENRLGQLKAPHFRCRCGSALFCPGPDLSARRVCVTVGCNAVNSGVFNIVIAPFGDRSILQTGFVVGDTVHFTITISGHGHLLLLNTARANFVVLTWEVPTTDTVSYTLLADQLNLTARYATDSPATLTGVASCTPATPPTVASISPTSGAAAGGTFAVTISGTGFTGASGVTIGGVAATFAVVNATTITATAPAHSAGTADVVVTKPGSTGTGAGLFTYIAAPTVTAITRQVAPQGARWITITGTNFTGATAVTIGGVTATGLTIVNPTTITATTPAHAAGAVMSLYDTRWYRNRGGTLHLSRGSDRYNNQSGEWPDPGRHRGDDQRHRFHRRNSGSRWRCCSVRFYGCQCHDDHRRHSGACVRRGECRRDDGERNWDWPGTLYVRGRACRHGGQSGKRSHERATAITITGMDFTGATAVTIGGVASSGFTVVNATTITAVTPGHASGVVNVVVTTASGTGTGPGLFTYLDAPAVTAVSPASGPTSGGTAITITGTDFTGATAVTIGGVAATATTVVDANTITGFTPVHAAGAVDVAVTTPRGTPRAADFTLIWLSRQ